MNLQSKKEKTIRQLVIKSFVILTSSLDPWIIIILDSMEFSLTAKNAVLLEL